MSGHIKRCFLNVNMGNRHAGLQNIARNAGIEVSTLTPDSYLVFVNTARDKVAMLVGAQTPKSMQTMAYVRLESGRKIDHRVIKELPRAFDGKTLNYDKALSLALDKALNRPGKTVIEMV